MEWGSFESVAFIVGLLHQDEIFATHVILTNTVQVCFMLPLGFAIGAATRVGNLLGAGKSKEAKQSFYTLLILVFGVYIIQSNTTYFLRYFIAKLYTTDPVVIENYATYVPFISYLFEFVDPFQGSLSGVLR